MIQKISLEELRVGMYVCGILLKSQGDVEKMLWNGYACLYINVDDEPAAPPPAPPADDTPEAGTELTAVCESAPEDTEELLEEEPGQAGLCAPAEQKALEEECPAIIERCEEARPQDKLPPTEVSFDEEFREAQRLRGEAELLVREFLQNARLGKDVDTGKVTGTVGRMVDSVFRNQDALTSLARLKSFDDYTFAHCVNVCILSLALGRQMGLERADLEDLGTGAILHDIGKMLVPDKVLNKPGKLTDEEFAIMKTHAELGGDMLSGAKINEAAMLVALQHHERYDGSGYYKGLAKSEIHIFARIAAVADVYDAMTSKRVYQPGMVPEEALKRLYLMRGTHFQPEIVETLIKCLGIYPIGTFVELNTGELAIVKMVN
ncbi:MAG: HD-GYP domain-containing protein, partial [Deltaproteobacteria bacterium]|nr:HD-GYP domain-containing protein [Deltaproteobacteria bacterium]